MVLGVCMERKSRCVTYSYRVQFTCKLPRRQNFPMHSLRMSAKAEKRETCRGCAAIRTRTYTIQHRTARSNFKTTTRTGHRAGRPKTPQNAPGPRRSRTVAAAEHTCVITPHPPGSGVVSSSVICATKSLIAHPLFRTLAPTLLPPSTARPIAARRWQRRSSGPSLGGGLS